MGAYFLIQKCLRPIPPLASLEVAVVDVATSSSRSSFETGRDEPDPASNKQTVLISKRSVKEMQILGLAGD